MVCSLACACWVYEVWGRGRMGWGLVWAVL